MTTARSADGDIQITLTIPWKEIEAAKEEAVNHLGKDITIPGFRKGKAPAEKIAQKLSQEELINHALGHILPKAFSDAITKEKIKPALYPKFELVSAKTGEDWQVRAITCELPSIVLGNYKEALKSIDKKTSQAEREQAVIKILLEKINLELPKMIIKEEVDARLSRLLERIEKLGLKLESYLSSLGKTVVSLREEYETQTRQSIALELILNEIARKEEIKVTEAEVEEALKASDIKNAGTDQKTTIKSIIARRKTLEKLASMV